jgi:signal peptidase I
MGCKSTTIFLLSIMLFGCAKEDANESANALFVEATKLLRDAPNAQTDAAAASIYRESLVKLNSIVTKYPSSNLAVQLALTQQVGDFGKIQRPIDLQAGSMAPALRVGDKVITLKYAEGSAPKRGDVIAFPLPKDVSAVYFKRLIGLPGERIQMISGLLHINGGPVKRERIEDFIDTDENGRTIRAKRWRETLSNGIIYETIDLIDKGFYDDTPVYTIPPGHYFVIGDNRDNSTDSRVLSQVGYIPADSIIGRVIRP